MNKIIALIGRPNVGKSTLFNQLTQSKDAIVADYPSLTRDRKYGKYISAEKQYIITDTAGLILKTASPIEKLMTKQSLHAIEEAHIIFFIVDGRQNLTATDENIANILRKHHKKIYLIINKIDNTKTDINEFYQLGLGSPYPISAINRQGISSLMESLPINHTDTQSTDAIQLTVIGRPNVGKSTLINRILGEERLIVCNQPGTTRDSITTSCTKQQIEYIFTDTAGVRKKSRTNEKIEKFSILKTLQAINNADIVIMIMNAHDGITDQDLHLISYANNANKGLILAMNKWDNLTTDKRLQVKKELDRRLSFIRYAKIEFISAKYGSGIDKLYQAIQNIKKASQQRWSSKFLTDILQHATQIHQPPLNNGHRTKLRFCHMGGNNPLKLIIHGNRTSSLAKSYYRFLENKYRDILKIPTGTPLKIEFKSGHNPFAEKINILTHRQQEKRQRMIKYVKQKKYHKLKKRA